MDISKAGGGGGGSNPIPEPGAALLFAFGSLVIARGSRRSARRVLVSSPHPHVSAFRVQRAFSL